MTRKSRPKMIEETRKKLVKAARYKFGTVGYAETIMDELTSEIGMTRGALYHHFGDKRGLFLAVVQEIDAEMNSRLQDISASTDDLWLAFKQRCRIYLEMSISPEIQRIILRDAPSILGSEYVEVSKLQCISSMKSILTTLIQNGKIVSCSPEALAQLINGGLMDAAFWIGSADIDNALEQALESLEHLLNGLCKRPE